MLEAIAPEAALGVCSFLSIFFVISLYAVDPGLPRNNPLTVRRRIEATSVVCLVSPCMLYLFMTRYDDITVSAFINSLGLRWSGLAAAVIFPPMAILILYAGPIFQNYSEGNHLVIDTDLIIQQRKDIALRNYVFAPVAEELIFRACMLPILSPAIGEMRAVIVCPLFFGVAHVHHLIEWYRVGDGTPFNQACVTVVIQACYTTIFGIFAGFIFVRSHHLVSLVLCHSLCNMLGLPSFETALQHRKKHLILSMYVLGIVLFFVLLFPLTSPSLYY